MSEPDRQMGRVVRAAGVAALAAALTVSAVACPRTRPAGPADSTRAVAAVAGKTIAAGTSKVAMEGTVRAGETSFAIAAEGAFDFKTQNGTMNVRLTGHEIPDAFGGFDLLFVDRELFMKLPAELASFLPGLKPWIKMDLAQFARQASVPGFDTFTGQDPTSALNFLRGASAVTVAGRESIRGEATTHYRATIDVAKAGASLAKPARAGWETLIQKAGLVSFPMEVWIDDRGLARRMHFTMAVEDLGVIGGSDVKGRKGMLAFTTDLYAFGTRVAVAAPAAGRVSDYAELVRLAGV